MKKTLFLIYCITLLVSPASSVAENQVLVFSGSSTFKDRILAPNSQNIKKVTGVTVGADSISSLSGFRQLQAGKVIASTAGCSLQTLLDKEGLKNDGTYQEHKILDDVIVPITHRSNPIKELSWEQLTDIYTGAVRNWRELGGQDVAIIPVIDEITGGTRQVFSEIVMHNKAVAKNAKIVDIAEYILYAVARDPGSIGIVSEGVAKGHLDKVSIVATKPIARPLIIVTKGPPDPAVQKVIDFLRTPEAGRNFK